MDNIKDGNIKVYPVGADMNASTPAEHIVELTSTNYGQYDIYYGPAQLEEGEYFYICSAPTKGRVLKDLTIDASTPDKKFIDEIVLKKGIAVLTGTLTQYIAEGNTPMLIEGMDVYINRLKGISQLDGTYVLTDIPEGAVTLKLKPKVGYEDTYQALEAVINVSDVTPTFSKLVYAPFNVRIRLEDSKGQTYTNGYVQRVTEGGSKIERLTLDANGQYVWSKAWDGTHRFRAYNAMDIPICDIKTYSWTWLLVGNTVSVTILIDDAIK